MSRFLHRLAGRSFPLVVLTGFAAGVAGLLAFYASERVMLADLHFGLLTVLAFLCVLALGVIFGVVCLWPPIGHRVLKFWGWPFQIGERVEVLTGPEARTIAQVYEVWQSRCEVRLDLGAEKAAEVQDVLAGTESDPSSSVDRLVRRRGSDALNLSLLITFVAQLQI